MPIWLELESHPIEPLLPDLDPLIGDRLTRLGLVTEQQARAFLKPELYQPTPAAELPGLKTVAERIEKAIHGKDPIWVWGDFDVDGQTSTTILVSTLRDLGGRVNYHIPVRGPESHGLNIPHLAEIIDQGAKLILTCDTGISAHEAIEYANSRGVDVVITDHHDLPAKFPPAIGMTNPKFLPVDHPLASLSGSGVAYKLAEELYERFGQKELCAKHLDLAALGLIADLAELKWDARYIVQLGLKSLRNTNRLGLRTLMDTAELVPENLTEEHIGFVIAPRLNALGRLADANDAVELFTTTNPVRAKMIVSDLESLNSQRQLLTSQVYEGAEAQLRQDPSLIRPVIVLAHPAWPAGVIGIAASRLVDRYHCAVVLLSTPPGEPARGSARSIEGVNISAAIARHKDLLQNFGGHPMAAGLSIDPEKIPEFTRSLKKTVSSMLSEKKLDHVIRVDRVATLGELNLDLADTIEQLAPFGPGNPKLVLVTNQLRMLNSARIGRQKEHLKFQVEDASGNQQTVLWWNAGNEEFPEGNFDLAYNLRASDWKGLRQIQMEVIDIRISEEESIPLGESKVDLKDLRKMDDLKSAIFHLPKGAIVWVEGSDRSSLGHEWIKINPSIKISDRNELTPSECLTIFTSPPSPKELKTALERVNPKQIIILKGAIMPASTEAFMGQLMGLVKHSLNHHDGIASYTGLAAATAQRESAIRSGLSWMVYQGHIRIEWETGDEVKINAGTSLKDPIQSARIWVEIRNMLEETSAYRIHFRRAELNFLFP
jgi:single-stranded-DNA-specific exonuclease